MTLRFQIDVICDDCEDVFHGIDDYGVVQAAMTRSRESAQNAGWIQRNHGVMCDLCPQCQMDERGFDAQTT